MRRIELTARVLGLTLLLVWFVVEWVAPEGVSIPSSLAASSASFGFVLLFVALVLGVWGDLRRRKGTDEGAG